MVTYNVLKDNIRFFSNKNMGDIKLSTMVGEYFEICLPQMARNALKVEAIGNMSQNKKYMEDNKNANNLGKLGKLFEF